MRKIFCFLFCLASTIYAESYLIKLDLDSYTETAKLRDYLKVEEVTPDSVKAWIGRRDIGLLHRMGIDYELLFPETEVTSCPNTFSFANPIWNCYPTYQQYVDFLNDAVAAYPGLITLEKIADSTNSVRPHAIWVVKISDNVALNEPEPEVFLSSSMHGDELAGYVLLLRFIRELLTGYGNDATLTALVDDTEIWIAPLTNPDGAYYSSDTSVSGAIRYYTTSSGSNSWVDPNRNFPDPQDGMHPDGNPYWKETEGMLNFARKRNFVISANYHGGAEVVNYPWDTMPQDHVDTNHFISFSSEYATNAQNDAPSSLGNYMTDLNNGITNGYDWYEVNGGRQDYQTYFRNGREVTIEVSSIKTPSASLLPDYWVANRNAIVSLIKQVGKSVIKGIIYSSQCSSNVRAKVELVGHDSAFHNSYVYSQHDNGDYYRMVNPGTYTVSFSAPGFNTVIYQGITVSSSTATVLNVDLDPTGYCPIIIDDFEDWQIPMWNIVE